MKKLQSLTNSFRVETPPTPGTGTKVYVYGDPNHLHAVTDVSVEGSSIANCTYDDNGNMTCRREMSGEGFQTFIQDYNVENRSESVQLVSGDCTTHGETLQSWAFTYDGDGNKVQQDYYDGSSTVTTLYFFGGAYEVKDPGLNQTVTKYYAIAGITVAMDNGSSLIYFLTDHLGSVIALLDTDGDIIEGTEQRYLPFGKVRTDLGTPTQTDFGYTFQRNLPEMGLMDYKARFYDPTTGNFIQPDTIIPDPLNSQEWNRYSYVINNPFSYTDPSGQEVVTTIVVVSIVVLAVVAVGMLTFGYQKFFTTKQVGDNLFGQVNFPNLPPGWKGLSDAAKAVKALMTSKWTKIVTITLSIPVLVYYYLKSAGQDPAEASQNSGSNPINEPEEDNSSLISPIFQNLSTSSNPSSQVLPTNLAENNSTIGNSQIAIPLIPNLSNSWGNSTNNVCPLINNVPDQKPTGGITLVRILPR